MKTALRSIILIMAVLLAGKTMSQGSSVSVYSDKGVQFSLYVNGVLKNDKPSDHAYGDELIGPTFKLRVVFKDPGVKEISKSVFNKINYQFYYVLREDGKGGYKLEQTSTDYVPPAGAAKEETPPPAQEKQAAAATTTGTAAKSTGGCANPVSEPDLQASMIMMHEAPFEGPKTSNCKKYVEGHCLYSYQIIEVMHVVDQESSRLTIAKAAYLHCFDPENYGDVKDDFHSSKMKSDLEAYIQSVKK